MNNSVPVIIFLGAPGVGKGTQAAYLSREKRIPKISTGDMLRHAVQDESELGRKVQQIMKDGKLVDDQTMLELVRERIKKTDCEKGFILDGYPRNLHQAAQLESVLPPHMNLCVFELEASEDEIVKRVAGRRTCPKCNRIYNVYFHPPASDEVCDVDRENLFRRNDDSEDIVRRRIETYKSETLPLIGYYKDKGVLRVVNGLRRESDVLETILSRVGC